MTDQPPFPSATPTTLRCPKCHGEMATYERSGVVIDQCRECRGVFLDRGELERLVDAEEQRFRTLARGPIPEPAAPSPYATHAPPYAAPTPPYAAPESPWGGGYPDDGRPTLRRDAAIGGDPYDARRARRDWDDDDDDDDRRRYDERSGRRPSKRRSLLGELLEGLGD